MFKIIDKRGTGKTSRLMLLAKETGATIVCANPHAFEAKAKAYGIEGLTFISYSDMYDIKYDYGQTKLLIDEIDELLKAWDDNIIGFNMSMED